MAVKPRLLFLSGREAGYIRNRVLLNAARSHFEVTVLTTDASVIPRRIASSLSRFITHRPQYDICLAGFYGQPIAIALSILQARPIILDAYVSTYDTLCEDRRRFHPRSPFGRIAYWLDWRSCQVAASIITDTKAQAQYFSETFGVPSAKVTPIYVGCDETLFYPRSEVRSDRTHCEVFYYSAFLPLHGTETIVRAAYLLRDRPEIRFTLGGDGPRRRNVERLIEKLSLTNVALTGWIPIEQLPAYIARASVCLGGHFSTVPKAARVISTKTFQFIAMRKPTIVGDNPATCELFTPGEHVCAVQMGNPQALAEAIRVLAGDEALRRRIASGGYQVFKQQLTTRAIADKLAHVVEEALCESVS
jgi:glycosyltransferase involved in cell wall biosynthesis